MIALALLLAAQDPFSVTASTSADVTWHVIGEAGGSPVLAGNALPRMDIYWLRSERGGENPYRDYTMVQVLCVETPRVRSLGSVMVMAPDEPRPLIVETVSLDPWADVTPGTAEAVLAAVVCAED